MLNENRLRLMTKMAIYQQENPNEFKMNEYYRHDYIGVRFLGNLLWFSIAFFMVLGVIMLINMDAIMDKMTIEWLKQTGITIGVIYLAFLFVCGIIGHFVYGRAHKKAKMNMREYYGDLRRLDRMNRHEDAMQNRDIDTRME